MPLTLRIENYDSLEDGGPLWFSLDRQSASAGRGRSMDWVLPDPAKHISSHHFSLTYADGHYWITDVSTNGTFIQGQRHRLQGPYCLQNGERLLVGHYIIGVQVTAAALPAGPWSGQPHGTAWDAPAAGADDADPWEFGGTPVPPAAPIAPAAVATPMHGLGSDFLALQQPSPYQGLRQGAAIQSPGMPNPPVAQGGYAPNPSLPPAAPFGPPPALQMPDLADHHAPRPAPVPPAPQPVMIAQPATPTADPVGPDAIVAAFCAGAGINPLAAHDVPPAALAHLLGQVVRISTEEIMRMLQDRANVKHFTKGGDRTMRSATGNNPMKFLPDAEQAIEAMFLRPRDGFMTGPDGYKNALKDLSAHQLAVFAALQPALAHVLDGISPEQIEAAETTGNLLSGSRKSKSWDLFVKRWEEKESTGEHGLLDAFLKAFASAYAQANARND
jgi:type VI secretion system protein ImpI